MSFTVPKQCKCNYVLSAFLRYGATEGGAADGEAKRSQLRSRIPRMDRRVPKHVFVESKMDTILLLPADRFVTPTVRHPAR